MRILLLISLSFISLNLLANEARFRELIDPVIYSPSYEVPSELTYIEFKEQNEVPEAFKERIKWVRREMLWQIVSANPWLCRPDYYDPETDCLSPLRGAEYYLVYDKGEVLGFVFIGYILGFDDYGVGTRDVAAYRYVVYKTGHVVQNGFFDL